MYHLICDKKLEYLIVVTPSYASSDWSKTIPTYIDFKQPYNFGARENKNKPITEVLKTYKDRFTLLASSDILDFHLRYPPDIPIQENFPEAFI